MTRPLESEVGPTSDDRDQGQTGSEHSGIEREYTPRYKEASFLQLVNTILRHRRAVLLAPVVTVILALGVGLVGPRTYTTTTSFTPEGGGSQASGLASLAGQFGIEIPTGEVSQSPQFYAHLLQSRNLLQETVVTSYDVAVASEHSDRLKTGGDDSQGDLTDLLGIHADSRRRTVAAAIKKLRELVDVTTDRETGVVELSVTTRWPDLSRQVADRMVTLVNQFNLKARQSQAAAERHFIAGQLSDAQSALRAAEDSLQRFLDRNRQYRNSPELQFDYERLQRHVDLRQQVYTSLSQSYQRAKIDQVRNTPVITVVEPAELPVSPDPRRLLFKGILGFILGCMVGMFWAFGRETLSATRYAEPGEYAEFARLKGEAAAEIRSVWRGLRRAFWGQ